MVLESAESWKIPSENSCSRPHLQRPYANNHHSGPRERVWKTPISKKRISNNLSVKDKAQHAVILDKATSDKLYKDVQSYRLVTVATLVDRLKINGSLARRCLKDLEEKGQIKKVVAHSKLQIYSMLPPRSIFYGFGHGRQSEDTVTDDQTARAVAAAE